ncbi:MAG: type I-U CRISPR-associated protein Csx17 [Longimicrobiales bacterium]
MHRDGLAGSSSEPDRFVTRLDGCRPTPLASYLKALGILRLVATQKDESARGWWQEDTFHLESKLDADGITAFFLEEYEPTPIVGPWGARSGFYPGSSEASARRALETIMDTSDGRLAPLRRTIRAVRGVLKQLGIVKKSDGNKHEVLTACRSLLPDDVLQWLDACYVLVEDEARWPPLLGTGGNEGSGSYSSGFSQMVVECLVERTHHRAITGSLFGGRVPDGLSNQTPGQFDPGRSGGANASTGFESAAGIGAWDYLLVLEGTLAFSSAVTRRHDADGPAAAAFPFMTNTSGAGSGAIAIPDEDARRGEIWCPIWDRRARYREVEFMFREGRATVRSPSGRHRVPNDGLGFARAAATLGVDRGIREFERHAFLKRHGRNVVAVPLGRRRVSRNPMAALLIDLDGGQWLSRFRRLGRAKGAPARLTRLVGRFESALFELAEDSGTPISLQRCLAALGECQRYLSISPAAREKLGVAVPVLSREWATMADDGSPEYAIAASLAGLHGRGPARAGGSPRGIRVLPSSEYMAPVSHERRGQRRWALDHVNRVVWTGGALDQDLGRMMSRRLLDQREMSLREVPLHGDARIPAELVAQWLDRPEWDRRIADLMPGIALVNRVALGPTRVGAGGIAPPAAYCLLKPFFVPASELDSVMSREQVNSEPIRLPPPSEIVRLLRTDQAERAFEWARARLRGKGLTAAATLPSPASDRGARLLAALLVPIRRSDLRAILRRYFDPDTENHTDRDAGAPASTTSSTDD